MAETHFMSFLSFSDSHLVAMPISLEDSLQTHGTWYRQFMGQGKVKFD